MSPLRLTVAGAALAATLAVVPAAQAAPLLAPPATQASKPTIVISGSTSMYPLIVNLAKAYSGKARFRALQGGSDIGIADVSRGRVTLGASSRDPQGGDPGGLVFNKIARDGVCVITHPRNPVRNLSQAQIQAIFSGSIRNWRQVPGAKVSGSIQLYVRGNSSGTADSFGNIFMGPNRRVAGSATPRTTTGQMQASVAQNPSSIGYVSFEATSGTNAISYKGIPCTLRNAKSGQYPGTRNFWLVSRGRTKGAAKGFISFIRSSAGQRIVSRGWVALR